MEIEPRRFELGGQVDPMAAFSCYNFPSGTFTVTVTGTPYNGVPSRTATITVTVH